MTFIFPTVQLVTFFMSKNPTKLTIDYLLLTTLLILVLGGIPSSAKARKKVPSVLVPPPPAYMPSILPELKLTQKREAPKPVNQVMKYVYTREGYEDPPPVKANEHVTYWNNSETKAN